MNIRQFGKHPELLKAIDAYKTPEVAFDVTRPIDLQTPLENLSQAFAEAAAKRPVPQTERCGEKA